MLNNRPWNPWVGYLLVAAAALAGCAPKTDVSTTGNVPAQYSHLYMSVQEVWFNTSATAGPDDTTWAKFPLSTPVTVDLAASVDGTVTSLTTGLKLAIGTYQQVRLIPVDSGANLLSSASSLGAKFNSEVDFVDSTNTTQQLPLELQNPEKGIGIQTNVTVVGNTEAVFSSSSSSSSTSTTSSTTGSTATSTGTTTTASTTTKTFSLAINVDGAKDLVPFTYGNTGSLINAMLLNPHVTAYDQSASGAIRGTLDISALTGITSSSTSSYVDIQVTAESLSSDGSRHIAVNSAPVRSDGTFTLYPLDTTKKSPVSYDLVIHGPAIATIIVKDVTVGVGAPSSTTPVNIGTITPRAATSFPVNLNTTTPIQAGAPVGFYQTLPGSSEVPYVIEQVPVDPFNRTFETDKALSASSIDYGTYASGSNVALTTADPVEGGSTYRVAATAPLYADGVMTTTITAPKTTTVTTLVTVPVLTVPTGVNSASTTLSISQATAKKYDSGNVIISHDGAIVATAALNAALSGTGTSSLALTGIPGGGGTSTTSASGLYYVSVRVWNSGDPAGTLVRETFPAALDLRSSVSGSYSLTIN